MLSLNGMLNRVHEWGEPDQHPMKRMVLTRIGSTAALVIEVCSIGAACFHLGMTSVQTVTTLASKILHVVFPKSKAFSGDLSLSKDMHTMQRAFIDICKLIAGLASTLFVGIFFSPEINFRIHLKLGLAIDNLALRKQKELQAKLDSQAKAAEIAKMRAERIAQFQAERQAIKEAEEQENAIDERLAELLLPQLFAQ